MGGGAGAPAALGAGRGRPIRRCSRTHRWSCLNRPVIGDLRDRLLPQPGQLQGPLTELRRIRTGNLNILPAATSSPQARCPSRRGKLMRPSRAPHRHRRPTRQPRQQPGGAQQLAEVSGGYGAVAPDLLGFGRVAVAARLRLRRRGPPRGGARLALPGSRREPAADRRAAGDRWFVDETYVKVAGTWRYVYRAVDQHGQVIDVYVSKKRDVKAATRFFSTAIRAHVTPLRSPPTGPRRWHAPSSSCCLACTTTPPSTPTTGSKQTTDDSRPGSVRCAG